jgi:hypothetical protein
MNEQERLKSEKLVDIHRARDEWEGNIIVGFLKDNAVEATLQAEGSGAVTAAHAGYAHPDTTCGIFVLEHEAECARQLIRDFQAAVTDEKLLDEAAAHKLKLDKQTISQLRAALREERRTFDFLGWLMVVFLGAAALLWAIWPAWLKIEAPAPEFRWVIVVMLALAAVFAGNWANKRMR